MNPTPPVEPRQANSWTRRLPLFGGLVFAALFALLAPAPGVAHCCSNYNTGPNCCNIFGCNCSGPCWNNGCTPLGVGGSCDSSPIERLKAVDTNDNGSLSLKETTVWLKKTSGSAIEGDELKAEFKRLDQNGNGSLEPAEFDFELEGDQGGKY